MTSGVQDGPRSARDRVAALAGDGTRRRVLSLDALADAVPGAAVPGAAVPGAAVPGPVGDPDTVPLPPLRPARQSSWRRRWLETWVPARLRGVRLDPGRPAALALAVVTASAAVLAAIGVWAERPIVEPAPPLVAMPPDAIPPSADPSEAGPAGPAPAPAAAAAPLVVSVVGKVGKPGLVQVPDGARVADALVAAGGPLPGTDLLGLNLARKVADGEQLAVGVPQPAAAGELGDTATARPAPVTGGQPPSAGRVDLNRATLQQLDALPGIGPVTAQRILDWRAQHGRFARVEQLREVDGIGERRFAQLRELVAV